MINVNCYLLWVVINLNIFFYLKIHQKNEKLKKLALSDKSHLKMPINNTIYRFEI